MCHLEEPLSKVLLDVIEHPLLCGVRGRSSEVVSELLDNAVGEGSISMGFATHAD